MPLVIMSEFSTMGYLKSSSPCYNRSMKDRPWEIYALSDPRTSKVRYVGVTFRGRARFREHLSRAICGGRTHRDRWIRSLVSVGLRPAYCTLERGKGDGWPDRERARIEVHRQTITNHTDGG